MWPGVRASFSEDAKGSRDEITISGVLDEVMELEKERIGLTGLFSSLSLSPKN